MIDKCKCGCEKKTRKKKQTVTNCLKSHRNAIGEKRKRQLLKKNRQKPFLQEKKQCVKSSQAKKEYTVESSEERKKPTKSGNPDCGRSCAVKRP